MEKLNNGKFSRSNWLILILFGTIGQIAWSVENMYFNLFVFDTISPDLNAITLMVQLSGITATVVTLFAGALSDKLGNRRKFISIGYVIWGVSVGLFGFMSPDFIGKLFSLNSTRAIAVTLTLVIAGDCVMTLFGSTANDAAFNAWVTDNTHSGERGKVEGVLSILPLLAMLIVAGGFGILVSAIGYKALFLSLGIVITLSGILGIFIIRDSDTLTKNGTVKDIFYGFRPSVVRSNLPFYITLIIISIYGISCQIFMPYLIIYMTTYLKFTVIEYSLVFGLAILLGAGVNLYLTRLSDRLDKTNLLYFGVGAFALGLLGMYFANGMGKIATVILFGIFGFIMICGYIFISALCGSTLRDYTPSGAVGKLQGVRMVFSVLIPMLIGPMIGNAINAYQSIPLPDQGSADTMTTKYIPAPEIFFAAAICALIIFTVIPLLKRCRKEMK